MNDTIWKLDFMKVVADSQQLHPHKKEHQQYGAYSKQGLPTTQSFERNISTPSQKKQHFNNNHLEMSNTHTKELPERIRPSTSPLPSTPLQSKTSMRDPLNRLVSIPQFYSRSFDSYTVSSQPTTSRGFHHSTQTHSQQAWNTSIYNKAIRASGQTHSSLSSVPEEMGKIESRNLFTEKDCDHSDFPVKKFQTGFNVINSGKSQSVMINGNYKGGHNERNNSAKDKNKTKKLLTSRSPRSGDDHHKAIMYAQFKDTSFYENDFRHRSMSESQAQLRKKVLEKRLRLAGGIDNIDDTPHRVTWADNLGSSLTCDQRRRSFSQGSTGLPNKPILKKLNNNAPSESSVKSDVIHPVDTRYL